MKRIIYILLTVSLLAACGTTKKSQTTQSAVALTFNADSAYEFCAAQCAFGPRTMNSTAHEQCAQWIQQKFEQYGYQVTLQKADLKGYDGTILKSTNIIATSPYAAASPQPAPRIFICAHWDSRPWADNDPDEANWHKPVMAANDGASGVAVMLELARMLQQNDSARLAVDFICFDAEDWGIPQWEEDVNGDSWALGAQYWAASDTNTPFYLIWLVVRVPSSIVNTTLCTMPAILLSASGRPPILLVTAASSLIRIAVASLMIMCL